MTFTTAEEQAQRYFEENFERFDRLGIAKYKEGTWALEGVDQSEWESFWLALDDIEAKALLKDIEQTGKETK